MLFLRCIRIDPTHLTHLVLLVHSVGPGSEWDRVPFVAILSLRLCKTEIAISLVQYTRIRRNGYVGLTAPYHQPYYGTAHVSGN
jgi:hypothetical protein